MSQVGRYTNLISMFLSGFQSCRKALHPRNWLLVAFIMVLFPLTKVLPLSSSTFKLILPGFINQTIDYTRSLRVLYNLLYLGLLYVSVVYIFSINIFVLQRVNFTKSCSRSRQLGKGHYLHTLLTMALLTVLVNFAINSVSSILVINSREALVLFQKSTGIVSKSFQVGEYTYVLRQILKGLLAPAVNNAALTVLFFQYIEERNLFPTLSRDIFQERKSSKRVTIGFIAAVLALSLLVVPVSSGILLTFLAGGVMLFLGMMFFGFVLAEEKEMIYIVVPTRKKDAIMRSVMDQAGIKQEAQAVCFSLPVTDTAGMRLPKEEDE